MYSRFLPLLSTLFVFVWSPALAMPELVAYWPLDEAANGTTPDVQRTYSLELVNLEPAHLVDGRLGKAFQFDAGRETLLVREHSAGDALPVNQYDAFSVSLWVKGKGTGQRDLRIFSEGSSADNSPLFNIGTDRNAGSDVVDIFIRPGSNHLLSANDLFDDTWRHLVWAQEANVATLYIDGVADQTTFEPASGLDVDITSIGGIRRMSGDSHWFTGIIDDVAVWEGALDASAAQRLAAGETPLQVIGETGNNGGGNGNPDNTPASTDASGIVISEFMASNDKASADSEGNYTDWIELHNPGDQPIQLKGAYLTDEEGETKWVFPDTIINAGEYLIVRASGANSEESAHELHTSFRLARDAEGYLGLIASDGVTVISEISGYPFQETDVSYGTDNTGKLGYFKSPSLGKVNGASISGFVADTQFSVDRGFYDESFQVELTTETEDATILYTLNGDEPKRGTLFTPPTGTVYEGPINIDTTSTIRAFAYKAGFEPTNIDTHTYIFVDDVAKQPEQPEGWPEDWGRDTRGEVPGRVVADYEMDPRVVNNTLPGYSIREALLDIPTLSVVMNHEDFIGSDGIYTNPNPSNRAAYERACSLELIYPDGTKGFQENCGIEIHGNSSRRPWRMQKHSMRISFKSQYGVSRLRFPLFPDSPVSEFNKIILRACFTDSWGLVSWAPGRYRPNDSQYIRDVWMKESLRDMGHHATYGNFMHLYVNGLYWGVFNPTEKVTAEMLSLHLGGEPEHYDVITNFVEALDGTMAGWNAMHALSRQNLSDLDNYRELQAAIDLENFADYMLLHFYADAEDWPHQNGHAIRNRATEGPFQFYVWDQEIVLDNFNIRKYGSNEGNRPGGLFQQLRRSSEFQQLFTDRVQKHLFNGGALSVEASQERYRRIADMIDKAIVAESARWGDTQASTPYGNNVQQPSSPDAINDLQYPPAPHGPQHYFTREDSWVVERDNVINHYIPATHDRSNAFAIINELLNEDMFTDQAPPSFEQHGGQVPTGYMAKIVPPEKFKPNSETIYYTIDGTDPRLLGGDIAPTAMRYEIESEGLPLTNTVTIRTRLLSKANPFLLTGEWSPLVEAVFQVGDFGSSCDVIVSELHYHPAAPSDEEREAGFITRSDFEYIELSNPTTQRIALNGVAFTNGITFDFTNAAIKELGPGESLLVVKNADAMRMRYGDGLPLAGTFEGGTQLANGGERITLSEADGSEILSFRYDDSEEWPQSADGEGYSLIPGGDLGEASQWTASREIGGTPGTFETVPETGMTYDEWTLTQFSEDALEDISISGPLGNPDADDHFNLIEFILGGDPNKGEPALLSVTRYDDESGHFVELRYPHLDNRTGVQITIEVSGDFENWSTMEGITTEVDNGSARVRLPIENDLSGVRLKVTGSE